MEAGIQRHGWYLNVHEEGFITPADEKRASVGWISAAHPPGEEEMVDALRLSTLRPNRGCCFIVIAKKYLLLDSRLSRE
uniref:Uncharacterized protein n=1 Tax=Candidatus Kentrum sp. UNK TaxID=2126344 RepID=A0A451AWG2_9GAMM|nr:MAG: hypothetical protein BECKUNK1418H_GA0071006_102523 [Candidatus Kentron sp. UNK]